MEKNTNKLILNNRKAFHEYFILEEFVAGIQLVGPEVKSIRQGKVSIKEAHCYLNGGELFIKSMHISEYKEGTYNNVDPIRDRKLLLTKKELIKLEREHKTTGITIVPLALFFSETGFIKIRIGLAKGKKLYDKREDLKKEDLKRELSLKIKM